MKSRLALSVLILLLLAGCAPRFDDPDGPLTSGIEGQVFIGPMCPVMQEGVPCPNQPYPSALTVLTPDGRVVMRFETDEEGKFAVYLPSGDYILHPETPEGMPYPIAAEISFTVLPGEFTNIIVTYDSGIR